MQGTKRSTGAQGTGGCPPPTPSLSPLSLRREAATPAAAPCVLDGRSHRLLHCVGEREAVSAAEHREALQGPAAPELSRVPPAEDAPADEVGLEWGRTAGGGGAARGLRGKG